MKIIISSLNNSSFFPYGNQFQSENQLKTDRDVNDRPNQVEQAAFVPFLRWKF